MTRVTIPGVTHMAIINGGDGSSTAKFFSSEERAEAYAQESSERNIVDISQGIEVDPVHWSWEGFQTSVISFILPPGSGGKYRADRVLALAEHFECAEGRVRAWANGKQLPSRETRELISEFIWSRS